MRINGKYLVILLSIFFLLGVISPSTGAEKIKLGLVGPFTGGLAVPGADMKRGAQLAVDEINSKGGIDKREIELVMENDEGVPAKSVNANEKLVIKDNVLTVIGSYSSSCTLANMKVTQKYEVPQICPISVATAITETGNKFIFRNCATNPMQIGQLADYAMPTFKLKNVGVIYVNTDFGRGIRDVWAEKANQYKIKLVADIPISESDTDFFSYLTKVKGINPDALLVGANITQATQIVLQAKNLGLPSQILGVGTFSDDEFWQLTKGKAEGIVHISYFEPESPDPRIRKFAKDFEAKYNKLPGMFAAAVYESVYIFEDAVKRAGTNFTDLKKWQLATRDAIASTKNRPGVQGGPTTFGPDGQADKRVYIVKWQQGKRVILYPPQK
jgi:branched-chain amino acid transport system substrate-binding protein